MNNIFEAVGEITTAELLFVRSLFNQQLNTVKGQIDTASIKINEYDGQIEVEKANSATDMTEEDRAARRQHIAEFSGGGSIKI